MNDNIIQFINAKEKAGGVMSQILKEIQKKSPEQLLIENGISLDPPIDLKRLIKNLGVNVKEKDFTRIEKQSGLPKGSILGATLLVNDRLILYHKKYNQKRNNHRERFTLAHEIGHCALHANDLKINHLELRNEIYNKNNEKERDANTYAGKLLIPEKSLKLIYNRLFIPSLKTLSEIFDVSTGVMKERLEEAKLNYYNDTVEQYDE